MKRKYITLFLLMVATLACAKKKPKDAENMGFGKGTGTVYLFGVSQMLTDSIVYATSINQIDSIDLDRKTRTLPNRSEFSLQLKEYLEGQVGLHKQTACVFFSTSRKKLNKQYYKIKKRYLDDKEKRIIIVDDRYFKFRHPLDAAVYGERGDK